MLSVNAEEIDPSPEGFLRALSPTDDDPIAHCNDEPCVVLIDAFAKVPWLTRFLQDDFLPRLARGVPRRHRRTHPARCDVDAMGRTHPVDDARGAPEREYAREYLERRSIAESATRRPDRSRNRRTPRRSRACRRPRRTARASATSTSRASGISSSVSSSSGCPRSLRSRTSSSFSRRAAIVRHFDEPTLAAITASETVSEAFGQLCSLSIVRAGEYGLMLHDDVRQVMSDDLRWRNPERFQTLRENALEHLRKRMAEAPRRRTALVVGRAHVPVGGRLRPLGPVRTVDRRRYHRHARGARMMPTKRSTSSAGGRKRCCRRCRP